MKAGLVEAERQQYYTVYRFRRQPLLDALRLAADPPQSPDLADDLAKYDQKILGDYLVAGKLKIIPAQRKKREVILRYLAERFEYHRDYSEKEINQILVTYHADVATLRRELIMGRLLQREHGVYRREPTQSTVEDGASF